MESKSEKWQLKRIGTMSFINNECDNVKQSDKSFFANIIKNIYLEVIADFKELEGTIENNTTELITEKEDVFSGCFSEITKTKCCRIAPITNENYCPNCGRKIKK